MDYTSYFCMLFNNLIKFIHVQRKWTWVLRPLLQYMYMYMQIFCFSLYPHLPLIYRYIQKSFYFAAPLSLIYQSFKNILSIFYSIPLFPLPFFYHVILDFLHSFLSIFITVKSGHWYLSIPFCYILFLCIPLLVVLNIPQFIFSLFIFILVSILHTYRYSNLG